MRVRWQGTATGRRIRIECIGCDGRFVKFAPMNDYYGHLASRDFVGEVELRGPTDRLKTDPEFAAVVHSLVLVLQDEGLDLATAKDATQAACIVLAREQRKAELEATERLKASVGDATEEK